MDTGSDPQTFAIIGAAMAVHSELGHGFLERVYQEALSLEFRRRDIPFQAECPIAIHYKGEELSVVYRADFVCYGAVLVETKALAAIGGCEKAQLLNYLKATGLRRGLILNFGAVRLQYVRLVFGSTDDEIEGVHR